VAAYDSLALLARRVQLSLVVLQLVGFATLLRSIAFDRWITVLASLFLLAGAAAAQRGKTWGVGIAFAAAAAFPVAFAIGIAPAWFCLVGLAGALPLLLTYRSLARFDKGATMILTGIAGAAGAAMAMAWKETAWSVFEAFPSLRPSLETQHGLALTATLAVVVAVVASRRSKKEHGDADAHEYLRVAEPMHVRVLDEHDTERFDTVGSLDDAADRDLGLDTPPARRRSLR
jgi:glucan phosphoethanolaminetransferase (alkaline phosphatase superfamily)